jgi:DUF1009 family protein
MTEDEVKAVIREVLAEQNQDHDQVVLKTIAAILTSFGIEDEDRKEIRADFIHLRKWRKSVEQAQGYTFKVVITTIVGGIIGAFWLGFQTLLHR